MRMMVILAGMILTSSTYAVEYLLPDWLDQKYLSATYTCQPNARKRVVTLDKETGFATSVVGQKRKTLDSGYFKVSVNTMGGVTDARVWGLYFRPGKDGNITVSDTVGSHSPGYLCEIELMN